MAIEQGRHLSVAVGVLTFHRPDRLRSLLPHLLDQVDDLARERPGTRTSVVVVDNDPGGSARPTVEAVGDERIRYHVEPRPGISHARNAVLDAVDADDVLVFIDDDESPEGSWLRLLLETMASHQAHAVAGRVVSAPDGDLDAFVAAGDFLRRAHREGVPTGALLPRAATNNLALDLDHVRRHGLRFDPRFGLTGGEDSLFTSELVRSGGRLVWCADAVVLDHVPASRMTPAYVLGKSYFMANSGVFVDLALARSRPARARVRLTVLVRELARLGQGSTLWARSWPRRSLRDRARGLRALARARGGLSAVLGHRAAQYAPTSTPDRRSPA